MSSVTTIIATLDEEMHIGRAVSSVRDLGPVFVVDAGSSDATIERARAAGAVVVEHPWEGYAVQKNWALANLPLETDWVMLLDADEVVTSELAAEIRTAAAGSGAVGYHVPRRNLFFGGELRHAWWYPDYQLRLFRRGRARFEERLVHEHVLLDGEEGFLAQPLIHENLKGIDAFVERHLRYAGLEAEEMLKARSGAALGQRRGRLLGTWPERRRALKTGVWYRLPCRPAIRFLWIYVVKRGFLDGRAGLTYASLLAMYEIMINAKLAELTNGAECRVSELAATREKPA